MSQVRFYGEGFASRVDPEKVVAYVSGREVLLPHSCDEWTIGGRKQAEQLIADLQTILAAEDLIDDASL